MTFASVYPHYVKKVVKKGRTEDELIEVIHWLTGFDKIKLDSMISKNVTLMEFFDSANIHPNAALIKGSICGYKIEEIENELSRKVRYMDKLVDELARGRDMGRIMR
jgi:hypothetical protein